MENDRPKLRIGDYDFHYVCDIEPVRDTNGFAQCFHPQDRYWNARNLPLNKYGGGPFCKFTIKNGFQTAGVYVLTVEDQVRYVGECANLSARFNAGYGNISPRNCFERGQVTNCRLNNLIYTAAEAGQRIALWFLKTVDYKSVEASLRSALNPAWNRI